MNNITIINFIELDDTEKNEILSWRNNEHVRKWMHNSNIISQSDHYKFIKTLKENKNKQYFLVKEQNKKIGVINFIRMDEYTEFGVYTNPEYRGYGKKLMTTICNHGFEDMNLDRLVAEVFSHNKKALNLYLNFNFTIFKEVLNKRKRIIYLELKNENWKI